MKKNPGIQKTVTRDMRKSAVDPAWNYNPGAAPWEGVIRGFTDTLRGILQTSVKRGEAYIRNNLLSNEFFKIFVNKRPDFIKGSFPVAVVPKEYRQGDDAVLVMPRQIIKKQKRSRRLDPAWKFKNDGGQFVPDDYKKAQAILNGGGRYEFDKTTNRSRKIAEIGGETWGLVWDKAGEETVLISLFRLYDGDDELEKSKERFFSDKK